MKKIIVLALLVITISRSTAQGWLDMGIKGGYGVTFIVNNNVWKDRKIGSTLSFGNTYGAKLGYNFNEYHEVTVDGIFSTLKQDFTIKSSDSLKYDKTISYSTFDIALLYRHHSNGGYLEVGPQYSMTKKANESISISTPENGNLLDNYVSSYYAAVLGFGSDFVGTDNFTLMLGVRMTYGLNDLISDKGGRSQNKSYPMNDVHYDPQYTSYKATKPFSAMFMAELNFDLGYFANSSCGKGRSKFISF